MHFLVISNRLKGILVKAVLMHLPGLCIIKNTTTKAVRSHEFGGTETL